MSFFHRLGAFTIVLVLVLVISLAVINAQEGDLPPHPSVGQHFVPQNVDWEHPVYRTDFDNEETLVNWKLEGGRKATVKDGKLFLESNGDPDNHLVYWLDQELPAEFLLEFTVRPQDRKAGLNIVFFSTRGTHGESVFDSALKPRDGTFRQYHSSDLNGYHVSYWAGARETANLRKNSGFKLVATGPDLVVDGAPDAFQVVRIYKAGGTIRLTVDDVIALALDDDGRTYGPAWNHPGWIGLRQMGRTVRCEYDSLSVYPLRH